MSEEAAFTDGWLDAGLAAELPGLRVRETRVATGTGPSAPGVVQRLVYLSRRMTGAEAVAVRTRPIPQAYRQLFRHLGLDPDEQRTPIEEVIVERLVRGRYPPEDRLHDAIVVALIETGVPLWAVDEACVEGPLGLRPARAGERLGVGEHADELPAGRLVVADAARPVGVLFGALAPSHAVTRATAAMRLFTVQAPGVPDIHVDEALWTCLDCLASD